MKHADKWFLYAMIGGMLLLFGTMAIVPARPAAAQCGTAASSCKNCHETQGALPVSNNGAWHSVHAFGDFCEFCHGGNVQTTVKEEAHVDLVAPLGDVQASCQGCHPGDYTELAQGYASTLGVEIGAGGSADSGDTGSAGAGASPGGATVCPDVTSVSAPLGGEEIDFNLLYAEAATKPPLISNWGNVILLLLIAGTGALFFVTAWSWENWGRKVAGWINKNIAPIPQAVAAVAAQGEGGAALPAQDVPQLQALLAQKPELQRLLPRLMKLTPETLAALETLLDNPDRGSEIITAVGRVDTEVIATLRQIGTKDRSLLLALLKGM
jgi:hypothetical protein